MKIDEILERYQERITQVEELLGYFFKDKTLLLTALTHSSFVSQEKSNLKDYEVLEFLGDSVISLIVSEILIKEFPDAKEGKLSKLRSAIVSEAFLSELARQLKLNEAVLLSKSEIAQKGMERQSLLCDVFEAVFGAIYVDCGYFIDPPRKIFNNKFYDYIIKSIKEKNIPIDYKSILQVYTQKHLKTIPKYIVLETTGPEHEKEFTVLCKVEDIIETQGKGKSKKEAETKAAKKAYVQLKKQNEEKE
jgi:ribonuclease-3